MNKTVCFFLFVILTQTCGAAKILVVFPMPSRSHGILGEGFVRHLLEAGHEVTYITPFPLKNSNPKLHQIDVSKNVEKYPSALFTISKVINKEHDFHFIKMIPRMMEMTRLTIENENLQSLLNDPKQTFDVVIVEWILNEIYSGFAAVFNCPLIWFSSVEPHWLILRLIHEPLNPAYTTDGLSTAVVPFSFIERAKGLLTQSFIKGVKYFYLVSKENELYDELFKPIATRKGMDLPLYEEIMYNASILLTNSHVSFGQPISVPPNSKEIGGYHINANIKPLPQDLQKLMDEAKHGVIYFSMGSNAKSKDFPDVLKREILNVLGELKQTVIWKFEEDLPNRPKNVHIVQWAPQPSILAHPNCRLFITHGGLLSTTETVHFGVPVIVMPTAADQHVNAGRAVNKGFAVKVDLSYEMADEMRKTIQEVLSNPKYTERVKELSKIYHDRPVSPGKELVHWVEHVVKTRGAPHLRSPALMTPWYQKMYLDLTVLIIALLYSIKWTFRKLKLSFCKVKMNMKKTN